MTLHEYVATFCPGGAGQLRRLIRERTGVQLPYAYVWKWCNRDKPCSLSVENATLVHTATDGACSMRELQTLRKLLGARSKKKPRRKKARKRALPNKTPTFEAKRRAETSRLRKRVEQLQQQVAALLDSKREPPAADA
jgi:hypothetical protein